MFGKLPDRQPRRPPLRIDLINQGAEAHKRGMSLSGGGRLAKIGLHFALWFSSNVLGITLVQSSTSISGRSGTIPGSGSVLAGTWDGTDLGTTGSAFTTRNISGRSIASGKWGFTIRLMGVEWAGPFEC